MPAFVAHYTNNNALLYTLYIYRKLYAHDIWSFFFYIIPLCIFGSHCSNLRRQNAVCMCVCIATTVVSILCTCVHYVWQCVYNNIVSEAVFLQLRPCGLLPKKSIYFCFCLFRSVAVRVDVGVELALFSCIFVRS